MIEPLESVVKAYGNPSLAIKKYQKRRLDYDKSLELKLRGKKIDRKLSELVKEYEVLGEVLIKELPVLSSLTVRMGTLCVENLADIQAKWYDTWGAQMKRMPIEGLDMLGLDEIVSTFQRDHSSASQMVNALGICRSALDPANSIRVQSTLQWQSTHEPKQNEEPSSAYSLGHQHNEVRRSSRIFHSTLPLFEETPEESGGTPTESLDGTEAQTKGGYNVLFLAASLFEFNLGSTKYEAGYAYLTYVPGEVSRRFFAVVQRTIAIWVY